MARDWDDETDWEVYGRKGWSEMSCHRPEDHPPHVWDSTSFCFGPYNCPGRPVHVPKHAAKENA